MPLNSFLTPTVQQGSSLQLLDEHKATSAENTYTFNPTNAMTSAKFSEIIIIINGVSTAQLALLLQMNGIVSGTYNYQGQRMTGAAVANITAATQTSVQVLSSTAISGAVGLAAEIHIFIDDSATIHPWGFSRGVTNSGGGACIIEDISFGNTTATFTLGSFTILTSVSTWTTGTHITTYGIKRIT